MGEMFGEWFENSKFKKCLLNYNFHGENTLIIDASRLGCAENLNIYIGRVFGDVLNSNDAS